MKRCIFALALLFATFVAGCGSRHSPEEIDRGRNAVTAALDSWKANEPPTKLLSRPEPVEFHDELRSTHSLIDYTLQTVDMTDKDVIRYAVVLKLKDKTGKSTDREVVFSVALRSPIVVARDP